MFQWTFSDYVTMAPGAARLAQLRLHIKEVIDMIAMPISQNGGNGFSFAREALLSYLKDLKAEEKKEAAAVETSTVRQSCTFTTGRFYP